MSRGQILNIEYLDINEQTTRIEVWQDDYTGTLYSFEEATDEPLIIEWGDAATDTLPIIYGSSATVSFFASKRLQFRSLFSASLTNLVKIYKNDVIIWTGFIKPRDYTEPQIHPPIPISFDAYDGLGLLTEKDFIDDNGDAYSGLMTIKSIIEICLAKTGLELDLYVGINWFQTSNVNYVNYYTKADKYEGFNCFEVLEDLLINCRLMQREGVWWIIANNQLHSKEWAVVPPDDFTPDFLSGDFLAGDFLTLRSANADFIDDDFLDGDFSTGSLYEDVLIIGSLIKDVWFEDAIEITLKQGLNKVEINEYLGFKNNVIVNGDFKTDTSNWTKVNNGTMSQIKRNDKTWLSLVPDPSVILHAEQTLQNVWNSTFGVIANFYLEYKAIGDYGAWCWTKIEIVLEADSGTTYYGYLSIYQEELRIEWTTTFTLIRLNAYIDDGSIAYNNDDVNKEYSFNAKIYDFPEFGDIIVKLESTTNITNGDVDATLYTNVKLEFTQYLIAAQISDIITDKLITVNQENSFSDSINIDTSIGDHVPTAFALLLYNNGMRSGTGVLSSNTFYWGVFESDLTNQYGFNEFRGRLLMAMNNRERIDYNLIIADTMPGIRMLLEDHETDYLKLIENGITYDDFYQRISGRYTEVWQPNISDANIVSEVEEIKG